jgi:hypothetical protein
MEDELEEIEIGPWNIKISWSEAAKNLTTLDRNFRDRFITRLKFFWGFCGSGNLEIPLKQQ